MIEFTAIILKFGEQGEKTGWTYIDVPADLAQQLKPGNKKSFRVKGKLDNHSIDGLALVPMGEGNFILSLNAGLMKAMGRRPGAMLKVQLEVNDTFKFIVPAELLECFADEPGAQAYFGSLAEAHRGYFIKWIDGAKTAPTRASRIVHTLNALSRKMDYAQMIRSLKKPEF
ncbi:YdeI/OmpD-associated family protein [Mucilaginibacter sp.]